MSDSALTLQRISDVGYLNIRGDSEDAAFVDAIGTVCGVELPREPNTVSVGTNTMYWLGPNEWLLATPESAAVEIAEKLKKTLKNQHFAVNDLSGGQVTYRLLGDAVAVLLAKGCTLDLHPSVFGPGQCAQSGLAKSAVLLTPLEDGSGYEIVVRRSFADYLWQWLLRAGRDFGLAAT